MHRHGSASGKAGPRFNGPTLPVAAERPDLLGTHLRFATYLHENRHPYRCFHMDRVGSEALIARLPSSDLAAATPRDATLAGRPAEVEPPVAAVLVPEPLPPAPLAAVPAIDRDGLAVMRIGGELLTVDLARWHTGADGRAVVFDHDAEVRVEAVEDDPMLVPIHGRRVARARRATMKPYQPGIDRPALWVLGTVVASRPAVGPRGAGREGGVAPRSRGPRALGHSAAVRLPPPRADLAVAGVFGTA